MRKRGLLKIMGGWNVTSDYITIQAIKHVLYPISQFKDHANTSTKVKVKCFFHI